MSRDPQDDWLWWYGLWKSLITCACGALTSPDTVCVVCGRTWDLTPTEVHRPDGHVYQVHPTFAGALDWSDYVLLKLMHVEWSRQPGHSDTIGGLPPDKRPSQRVILVILFWTMFERLMQRFFDSALKTLRQPIADDLLRRHAMIGARLDRLYPLLFDVSFAQDLASVGYPETYAHITSVQRARNAFIHGEPQAVTDAIVDATVNRLPEVHRAWIALYNKRCANLPPLVV